MESKREDLPRAPFDTVMLKTFPTVKSYIEHMMEHYYSSPVIFKRDFQTCASDPKRVKQFSASLANQLLFLHTKLLAKGRLKADDPFKVLEPGGGDGNLCLHMLQIIEQRAQKEKEWAAMWNALDYTLLEYSPGLVRAQEERNKKYIESGKVRVIQGDALHLSDYVAETNFSLVLSNELIDMLQPHRVTMEQDRSIKINQVLPYISKVQLEKMVSKKEIAELEEQSKQYKEMLRKNVNKKHLELIQSCLEPSQIILSETSFVKLRRLISPDKYQSQFQFHEVSFASITSVPEANAFMKRHPQFVERMQPKKAYNIDVGIELFLREAKKVIIDDGEVIATDYFCTDDEIDHRFRTFRELKGSFNIYSHPGMDDITHDPNATIFVEDAKTIGLTCLQYNSQDTFSIEEVPSEIVSEEEKRWYTKSNINELKKYKAIVLANTESKEMTHDKGRFAGGCEGVFYADLAALPPVYSVNQATGELTINLTEQDKRLIDSYRDDTIKAMSNLMFTPSHDKRYEMARLSYSVFIKMTKKEVLTHVEKEILLLTFLQFRLSQYPAETDLIAFHLNKLTGVDWNISGIESDMNIHIACVTLVGSKIAMTSQITESLKKVSLEVQVLFHRTEQNNVLLRINKIPNNTPWNLIYSDKLKLTPNIHSPITAKGDAHARLVKVLSGKIQEKNKAEFKPFLDAIQEKNYAKALRRICTSTSSLAFDVTKEFLIACKELKISFDINETAGTENLSALHHAARKNNRQLCDLLISYGANANLLQVSGAKLAV